jgi:isochorismate synthase
VWGSPDEDLAACLDEERAVLDRARDRRPPVPARVVDDPAAWMRWRMGVEGALEAMAKGEVRKVVLARAIPCETDAFFDPAAVLAVLEQQVERSVPFLVDFGEGAAFVGASPELLFRSRGDQVESECVAGTAPRGNTAEEDEARAAAVMGSEKDRREHDYVVAAVRGVFERFCLGVSVDRAPELLTLSSVHHLLVGVRGRLRADRAIEDLLSALHPTPAVGGTPREGALEFLRRFEGSSRGWYAGPVGWIEPGAAEFVVAIRSALIASRRAWAFAGSGIVEGSDARSEWVETEAKARPMIAALTGSGV